MAEIRNIKDIDRVKTLKEINEKQKTAADIYLKCGNSRQALLEAGYSKKTADNKGFRREFFQRSYIRAYLEEKLKTEGKVAGQREVMEYLTELLRGDITEEIVVDKQMVSRLPLVKDRSKAAELLGRHYGMYCRKEEKEAQNKAIELKVDVDE
ncbi:MAG: terminase small subunit [Clostridiales bacterium]|nr:terminase small subunit [Clostridiales bacterium]